MSNTPGFGTLHDYFPEDEMNIAASGVFAGIMGIGAYFFFSQAPQTSPVASLLAITAAGMTYFVSAEAMWLNSPFRESSTPSTNTFNNYSSENKCEQTYPRQTAMTNFFAVKTKHPQGHAKDENTFVLDDKENSPNMQKR